MQIKIDIAWQTQLSRNLRLFADSLENLSEFYWEAIWIIKERSDSIFAAAWSNVEKNPKWKPLSAATITARRKRTWHYKNAPNKPWVLRWTWRLQDDTTTTINDRYWSFEYNAPYAEKHQTWEWVPKRAFLDLDNRTNENIVKSLQNKIQRDIWIFGLQA